MPQGLPEPPPLGASALPAGTYDGQTVVVTGAGTGLGKAIASEFARLGANIVVLSRKPEHLEAASNDIGADHERERAEVKQFLEPGWTEALKHGRIDETGAQRGDTDVLREVFGAKG